MVRHTSDTFKLLYIIQVEGEIEYIDETGLANYSSILKMDHAYMGVEIFATLLCMFLNCHDKIVENKVKKTHPLSRVAAQHF